MFSRFSNRVLLIALLVLSACGGGGDGEPTAGPTGLPGPRGIVLTPIPPAPDWLPPNQAITPDNVDQIRLLGRLDAPGRPSTVFSYAFSPDGTRLAALNNNYLLAWDLRSGELAFYTSRQGATVVYYAPGQTEVYTVDTEGVVRVLDTQRGAVQNHFQAHPNFSGATAFHETAGWLAVGGRFGEVKVWNPAERVSLVTIEAHTTEITDLAFSGDGALLATADAGGAVKVWNWRERALAATWDNGTGGVAHLAFSPDGETLAVSRSEGINLWRVGDGALVHTLETGRGRAIGALTYSPDGRYLLSGGIVPNMTLWDAGTGDAVVQLAGLFGDRVAVAFSPDGSLLLAAALDGPVALWNFTTGTRTDLETGADRPLFVDWSSDGYVMTFFDAVGPVYVWGLSDE